MFKISTEGAWDKWIGFCLNGTIQQAQDAINRCEKLCDLKDNMLKRVRPATSPRVEQIIHELFSIPIVRVADLHKKLNVTYPTAQADIDILVKAKILTPLSTIRPKSFYSPEIIDIAYQDTPLI
jgi:Fic family protein